MKSGRWLLFSILLVPFFSGTTVGQRLVDWPVRSSVLPDAVVTGVPAVFWNPASLSTGSYRAQALVMNLNAPEMVDLWGVAAAGAVQLERILLAVGYEHLGVSDFTNTTDSPDGPTFDLGEDHFTLAAAHQISKSLTVGAIARYTRDDLNVTDAVVGVGAGFRGTFTLPWPVSVGLYGLSESDRLSWGAGAELTVPAFPAADYRTGLAYGLRDDARNAGWLHRFAAQLEWKDRATVGAGINLQNDPRADGGVVDDGSRHHWSPILAASLRLHRYTLGVVRESLVHDFGATYSFHLQIGVGK